MTSSVNGAGKIGGNINPEIFSTKKTDKCFSRNIDSVDGKAQVNQTQSVSDTSISQRTIISLSSGNNDILTSQGLKNIAGDPKTTLLRKSPDYTALLNALDRYQVLVKNGDSTDRKLSALQDIEDKANAYSSKKEQAAKKVSGDRLAGLLAKVNGAEKVKGAVLEEKSRLELQALDPSSVKDIIHHLSVYEQAGALGAEYLEKHLSSFPPQTTRELLEAAPIYPDESLLEAHFDRLEDSGKARSLMIAAPDGSSLKKIAAESWAVDKIKRDVPALPKNEKELVEQESQIKMKLLGKKVPQVGINAAIDALKHMTLESWEQMEPVYQNIPLKTKANASLSKKAHSFEIMSDKLFKGLQKVPDEFKKSASLKQERQLADQYNALPRPAFNEKNNLLHSSEFKSRADVRFGRASRETDILPCPTKSAVKVGGEAIYHANHVDMPIGRYIAAQGPSNSKENQNNYWKMLDSQNALVSIDLTNTQDPSKAKRTIQYTPKPGDTLRYGETTVTNHGETMVMEGRFTLQQLEINGKPHTRIQYNKFDDRTSGNPADLVTLSLLARNISQDPETPVAVHCSAGIGRTGTLITIMDMVDHARKGVSRDPEDAIETFRKARGPKGVQTPGQLHTILETHQNVARIINPLISASS